LEVPFSLFAKERCDMILYVLLTIGGIFLLIFGRKRNKFLFAAGVACTTVGIILVAATLLLVFARE